MKQFDAQQMGQIDRDVLDFVRGRRRIVQVKRWVETQEDELTKENVSKMLAEKIRQYLYKRPEL